MIEFLLKDSEKRVTGFDVKDSFLVADAAPVTSPRTAEPGPGTLTFTDVENKLSVSGGKLVCAGGKATPASGDPGVWSGAVTRAAGVALLVPALSVGATNTRTDVGFDTNQAGGALYGGIMIESDGKFTCSGDGTRVSGDLDSYAADTEYDYAVVLRATGVFLFIKGGAFTSWTLVWVSVTGTQPTVYGAITNYNAAFDCEGLRIVNLPANGYTIWADDYGIATQRLAGARSAGDTFAHETTFLLEFTVTTVPSSGQIEVEFHREDADNKWRVTIDSTGALDLDEVVATVVTQRGTAAGVVANGDRIVVVQDGTNIKVYEANTLRITYAAGANTYTAGELETEGTGGAVSDLVTWPRTLKSGGAGLGRGATA